jgi:hypothetical protein
MIPPRDAQGEGGTSKEYVEIGGGFTAGLTNRKVAKMQQQGWHLVGPGEKRNSLIFSRVTARSSP